MILFVWDNPVIVAADNQQVRTIHYSGILERNQETCHDSFLVTLSFPRNTTVKVTVELDQSRCREESGGHIQFAFTKDEAHSLWADDIALYSNTATSYEETFELYAGTYLFEMHLIRDEFTHLPWNITLEATDNEELSSIDQEATCWFRKDWSSKKLLIGKKKRSIDLYKKLVISSWTKVKREEILYRTSNQKIATVSKNGELVVKKQGKVAIIVELPNGFQLKHSVIIEKESTKKKE